MPNIADLQEKRSRIMADANALLQAETITGEIRSQFDNAMVEADTLAGDIARLERSAAVVQNETRTNRPKPGATEDRTAQEKAAFRSWFATGQVAPEYRDILTINATGAATIPQSFYPSIIEAQKAWGGITNVVNTYATDSGASMKIALANDTGNMLHSITEGTDAAENDPVMTSVLSSVDELTVDVVKVSVPQLQDSAFDLEAWIRTAFGKRYFRGLSNLITNGNGTNFAGLLAGYSAGELTSASVGKIGYADIVALYGALDPAYILNAKFVMNSSTRAALMAVTDGYGRPLFDPSPNGPGFSQLLGCEVVLDQNMPNLGTGNVAIAFGDFNAGYLYRTVNPGLAITRLNERFMTANEIGFVGFARAGGVVTNPGGVSNAPVVVLKVQ